MATRQKRIRVAKSRNMRRASNSLSALAVAVLVVVICSMLVSCGGATITDPQAAQQAHARASLTAGAQVTQTARVAASQTVAAIPLIPLPYAAAAPGPGCDTGRATWTAQSAQGVSCLANPARLRLSAVADASTNTSQNVVDWVFGLGGKLPATYRISVQVSGLLDRNNTGQVGVTLYVNLGAPIDATQDRAHTYNMNLSVDGATANYGAGIEHMETGFVNYDVANLAKPTTFTIEVSASGISALLNGVTILKSGAPPQTVTGIALSLIGPAGTYADFANLSVEPV